MTTDRNFDPIADHFAKKVYGGLKGQIRLAVLTRDISTAVTQLTNSLGRPLKILDIGAGLAQISLSFALTHHVTINDISINMLNKAKLSAKQLHIPDDNLSFIHSPYQELEHHLQGQNFDMILCHAVLEWLATPKDVMAFFEKFLSPTGYVSLCFYNPVSLVYRNLIMGNFYQIDAPKPADNKSLTPNTPVAYDTVKSWLDEKNYTIICQSGIRVFSDYTPIKRGGLNNPEDVIAMELRYSQQQPFCFMGRYVHILACKSTHSSLVSLST